MKINKNNVKGHINLECLYERITVDGNNQDTKMNFSNKIEIILDNNDFIKNNFKELISREQRFSPNKGSGWSLLRCESVTLKLCKSNFLNARSYIELPREIKNKKVCINFRDYDEYCFIYAIICAINIYNTNIVEDPHRVKQYKNYINDQIFSKFDYPMKLDDIYKFENESLKQHDGYNQCQ